MPGGTSVGNNYGDPRFLQQKVEKLERDIAELKKATQPFAVHQKGPLPGTMRAVAINDPGLKAQMWANYTNAGPGSGPYSAVTDANGAIRAEWGNLAANGASGAQYGFRANDASGTPIFDSLGLIAVMKELGRGDATAAQNFTTTSFVSWSGTSVTFSLARQLRVLALAIVIGFSQNQTGQINLFVDGVDVGTGIPNAGIGGTCWWGANGPTVTSTLVWSGAPLAAGSHTLDLRGKVQNTPGTMNGQGVTLIVYGLGS